MTEWVDKWMNKTTTFQIIAGKKIDLELLEYIYFFKVLISSWYYSISKYPQIKK